MEVSAQPPGFLKVIAHELRWQLLTTLTRSDYKVQELIEIVDQPQNLVSYHLKQMRDARLVVERRSTADARDIYYSIDLDQLRTYYSAVGAALHPALVCKDTTLSSTHAQNQPAASVLFLCTENSARSQMAEGFLRNIGGSRVEVFSAGVAPSSVHPRAIQIMAEMGIDISQQRAKSLDEFEGRPFDYVITVCDRARETCPTISEDAQVIHWSLPDPAAVKGSEDAQIPGISVNCTAANYSYRLFANAYRLPERAYTVKEFVLILCTGNSARSQIAEGLLRELAGNQFEVFSAGSR
jgi:protein-tyrosine-phosphatase/DNA-binding transcriptional ArsR family regulator